MNATAELRSLYSEYLDALYLRAIEATSCVMFNRQAESDMAGGRIPRRDEVSAFFSGGRAPMSLASEELRNFFLTAGNERLTFAAFARGHRSGQPEEAKTECGQCGADLTGPDGYQRPDGGGLRCRNCHRIAANERRQLRAQYGTDAATARRMATAPRMTTASDIDATFAGTWHQAS